MPEATQTTELPRQSATLTAEQEQFLLEIIGSPKRIMEAQHEVQRELQVRERCYTKWVEDGKISKLDATERYNRLDSANKMLKILLDNCPDASDTPF